MSATLSAASVDRFRRLLAILSEVARQPGRDPRALAAACQVSERTLRRDLHRLRDLGFEVAHLDGYQLQGNLPLESGVGITPLATLYEQQVRLLRRSFDPAPAAAVEAEVESRAPAALARLFEESLIAVATRVPRPASRRAPAPSRPA